MRVPILRRAGPRSDGCGQPVALQHVDSLEVFGQGAGCCQTAHSRSNNDRPPTQLGRSVAVPRWHRWPGVFLTQPKLRLTNSTISRST